MPKEAYEIPELELNQCVSDLRKNFFQDFEKEKEIYDSEFVEMINADDNLLGRFIWNQSGNVDKATDQIKCTAKWRKEFGVKDITRNSLNQDLFKSNILYPNKWDHNGHPIMMLVVNRVSRDSKAICDKQKIVIYWIETILKKAKDHKLTFFIDCQGVGISNMDLEMMVFITNSLTKHYPNCIGYVLVYNMPRLFNVIWQVIKSILPKQYQSKVKFVNKETVGEFINSECLPERMGGVIPDFYDYDKMEDYEEQ